MRSAWSRGSALTRTRFVFWLFAVVVLAAAGAMVIFASGAPLWVRALAGLAVAWIFGRDLALLRTERTSLAFVPADVAALVAVVAAVGEGPATGVFFLGVFFRSLYGERRQVVANALAYAGVYAAAAFVFPGGASAAAVRAGHVRANRRPRRAA